jgi:hypothetical protein
MNGRRVLNAPVGTSPQVLDQSKADAAAAHSSSAHRSQTGVNLRGSIRLRYSYIREVPLSAARGRVARLREEYAKLYPGVDPGVWVPVEKLIRLVTDLIHKDRSKVGVITGERLLREEHFDFRGASDRPAGLPRNSTRLSDSGAEPPDTSTPGSPKEGNATNE